MNDFIFHNPAKVYFGKNQLEHLPEELGGLRHEGADGLRWQAPSRRAACTTRCAAFWKAPAGTVELAGVEPNPAPYHRRTGGAAICRQNGIDVVLAVGGGPPSTARRGVAAAAKTADGDVWPLVAGGAWVTDALPVAVVLTNAATGSEMDAWSVISNMDVNQKIGLGGSALIPRVAFENPEHSYTLPAYQTACGAFDIFNHVLDNYYLAGDATFDLVLEMQEAVMRTVVKWTPVALEEPQNYEARANLMWASSMALNTVLDAGTVHGCACHMMEHELSAYYDITHGHGLAILAPRWLEYILDDGTASAIYRLGIAVFGVEEGLSPEEGARRAIERVSSFASETLGLEGTLTELGIDEAHFQDMARHACGGGRIPGLRSLGAEDVERIYRMCL